MRAIPLSFLHILSNGPIPVASFSRLDIAISESRETPINGPAPVKVSFGVSLNGPDPVTKGITSSMIKTANPEVHAAIRRARAVIAAGVRLKKPDLETEGRQDFALASIENTIRLYSDHLTSEARAFLAHLLMSADDTTNPDAVQNTTKHNEEAAALRSAVTPADLLPDTDDLSDTAHNEFDEFDDEDDFDPDMEFEEDEDAADAS